jgi:hypothetical protein
MTRRISRSCSTAAFTLHERDDVKYRGLLSVTILALLFSFAALPASAGDREFPFQPASKATPACPSPAPLPSSTVFR